MIVKTDAIILKSMKYRETSKIVTMFSRDFGKISVIAKGSRGPKSKLQGSLEPLSHVRIVFYSKDTRDLQLLSQCDILHSFRALTQTVDHLSTSLAVIELLNLLTHHDEPNTALFDLALDTLQALDSATKNMISALYYFEIRIVELLGFRPGLEQCTICAGSIDADNGASRQYAMGFAGVACPDCAQSHMVELSLGAVHVLRKLQDTHSASHVTNLGLSAQMRVEVGNALRAFLRHHVEGFRGLKSESVFASFVS